MILFIELPWYDIMWIIVGFLFIIIGLIGCIVSIIPGPPLSFLGLLMLQLTSSPQFSLIFMLLLGFIVFVITILDYILPIWTAKKHGASKYAVWGSSIGLIIGLFVMPPFGIFIGAFAGAFIGEIIAKKTNKQAIKSSLYVFLGFIIGTIMKLALSGYMAYKFVKGIVDILGNGYVWYELHTLFY